MFGFKEMSETLDEMGNVSVAINGFESPAKPFKEKKPNDPNKIKRWLKRQKERRGE
jgi:hypothetical protein